MSDVDVYLRDTQIGELFRTRVRGHETVAFRYLPSWLADDDAFAIDPKLPLDRATSYPQGGRMFGALADSAPDRWGRRLMQRRERRLAEREGREPRALSDLDYVLGVSDRSRMGALRYRVGGNFVAAANDVPPLVRLREHRP